MIDLTQQWQVSASVLPAATSRHHVFRQDRNIVVMGGVTSVNTAACWSGKIHPSGEVDPAWQVAGTLPAPVSWAHIAQGPSGWLYLFGGSTTGSRSAAVNTILRTKLNPNGQIQDFKSELMPMYNGAFQGQSVIASNGYFYSYGPLVNPSGVDQLNLRAAKVNGDGTMGPWFVAAQLINGPNWPLCNTGLVEVSGYLVMAGGQTNPGFVSTTQIIAAKLNRDGTTGPWNYVGDLLSTRWQHASIPIGDTIVIVGGYSSGTTVINTVELVRVGADGSVSVSLHPAPLPVGVGRIEKAWAVLDGSIYIFGGRTASAASNVIQSLSIKL